MIFLEGDLAAVGRCLAEDERKECGFAGAVGADEADAVAAIDLERNVFEEGATAKDLLSWETVSI